DYFHLAKDEDDDLHAVVLREIDPNDSNAIFLVDHAWTFTTDNNKPREMLTTVPSLIGRMENLMRIDVPEGADTNARVNTVLDTMWKFVNSYRLGHLKPEEAGTIWYVMDEFGSAIEHSDEPNFNMAPFYYVSAQCAFSLLWPKEAIEADDFATLNYVPARDEDTRTALCAALFYPKGEGYASELGAICSRRTAAAAHHHNETQFSRDSESVPPTMDTLPTSDALPTPIKIWTDLKLMYEHLTDRRFEFTDVEADANVVWPTRHIKDYVALYENPNSLPAATKRAWTTFGSASHGTSRGRSVQACDVVVARRSCRVALDTEIATTAAQLAKLAQTGPKVACKYITKPFLIKQRKFDFRFLVMLVDTDPLQLYVSGVYWLRIANKPFKMDRFDDFETHFTVMNYTDYGVEIISVDEFEAQFKAEYPTEDWEAVKADIFKSIRAMFAAATANPPPLGLGKSKKSRALYGVDVMLEWTDDNKIHPVILETNFHPDCTRACKYFKDFYNDLLNVVVLNNTDAVVHGVTKL
ncbi:hypothetical protein DYB32_007816, partial [Aphanomyces invadans]